MSLGLAESIAIVPDHGIFIRLNNPHEQIVKDKAFLVRLSRWTFIRFEEVSENLYQSIDTIPTTAQSFLLTLAIPLHFEYEGNEDKRRIFFNDIGAILQTGARVQ